MKINEKLNFVKDEYFNACEKEIAIYLKQYRWESNTEGLRYKIKNGICIILNKYWSEGKLLSGLNSIKIEVNGREKYISVNIFEEKNYKEKI